MGKDLPGILREYKGADYITRERSRFIFYLSIAVIITIVLLITVRLITHPLTNLEDTTHLSVLLPLVILLFLICGCFLLLIKGYYDLSSHLLPTIVMMATWAIMFIEKSSLLTRMDTIVNIFMACSMIPLLVGRYKYSMLAYSTINILLVFVFVFYVKDEYGLLPAEVTDYLLDVSVSLAFVGFVGFSIFSINKRALDSAENDLRRRLAVEKEFAQSEKKYQELTELLPITIYESDSNGRIIYTNQAGYKTFGYNEEDFKKGVYVPMLVVEKDVAASGMEKILKGDHSGHQYTAIRKNGEQFPVQIYSNPIEDEGKIVGLRGVVIDISERNKAEDALRASERKFRDMTFLLPQTVYESDLNGNLTFMNRAGTVMFGYSDEDISQGLNIINTIAKDDHERVRENVGKIISGETSPGNQYTGQRKDGTTFPIQIHSSPIIENDKTVGFRGVVFDLTEIKKVENDLRQSNELFKTLIESIPISMSLSDLEGKFLMVNKAFCIDLRVTPEDAIGKTIKDLGVTTDKEREEVIMKILEDKGFVENFEISAFTKNGLRHELYVYATLVTINNQKVVLRSNINVTDKKNLENKLRESEILFRTIVNMVPYSITISDSENQITFANKAFLEKFHLDLNEVKGKTSGELGIIMDETSYQQFEKEYHENGSVFKFEVNILSPEQENICALLSSQPVIIDNNPHVIATTIDITDRKRLEEQLKDYNLKLEKLVRERTEELEAANEELSSTNEELVGKSDLIIKKNQELNEAIELIKNTQLQLIQTEKMASLGILTAGVAHEVNNPLNYLMGVYVGLENYFEEHGSNDAEKTGILLNSMQVGIERISNIVKGLNQFSRDNDSLEERCDIHAIIGNCLTMLHSQMKHKVELTKQFSDDTIIVEGNVGRLHQAFVNILSNSLHAIRGKGNIIIKSGIEGTKAVVEIIDDGVGIDKKHLPKITDPFFTTKAPGEGTGLGLSITQTIIQEHHGEIKFESEINKGTKVLLSFPLK